MKTLSTVVVSMLLLTTCSPQIQVYTDQDPDYDVGSYKTFGWGQKINIEEGRNPLYYNELNDKRIKQAITAQLNSRGYVYGDSLADFIIHYHIIIDNQSMITTGPFGYSYGPYWIRTSTDVTTYQEGTLIVDLMDPKTNNLMWRGWAVTEMDEGYKSDKADKLIRSAVSKIFKDFPVNHGKAAASNEVATN